MITAAPATVRHGQSVSVTTDSTIASLFLMAKAYVDNGGDAALLLEVRQSNTAARALYAAAGFAEVGLRRGYYPDVQQRREDAVVMRLSLEPELP